MIVPLFLLCSGAITFVQQDIKPILCFDQFGPATSVRGRSVDVDGDGAADLITSNAVYFQKNGMFTEDNSAKLPTGNRWCRYDVWWKQLFLFTDDSLEVYCWNGKTWERTVSQSMKFPQYSYRSALLKDTAPSGAISERVLYDVDSDGEPEIILVERDALYLYAKRNDHYEEAGRLNVWPRAQRSLNSNIPLLWPPETRRTVFLDRFSMGWFYVEKEKLTVVGKEQIDPEQVRYHITRYKLEKGTEGGFSAQVLPDTITTEIMPWFLEPARLDSSGTIWFVGGNEIWKNKATRWKPLNETVVTNDNGKTLQRFRTVAMGSFRPFIDLDGDGRKELLAYLPDTFDGGMRETIERMITSKEVTLRIEIRKQDENGHFPLNADINTPVHVQLAATLFQAEAFADCVNGRLMTFSSDLNGDGQKDLVIQDRPDRIALYLMTPQGLGATPAATVTIVPGTSFSVTDLDGDGRGDLMTGSPAGESSENPAQAPGVYPTSPFYVYLSRETKP